MNFEEQKIAIIEFFQSVSSYYGCKTEISEAIITDIQNFNPKNSTWNLSEFVLIQSAYRNEGNRFMMEGEKMYYEISAENIVSFSKTGRHKFEFLEQYSEFVFRQTKIRFFDKY